MQEGVKEHGVAEEITCRRGRRVDWGVRPCLSRPGCITMTNKPIYCSQVLVCVTAITESLENTYVDRHY